MVEGGSSLPPVVLATRLWERLAAIDGIRLLGPSPQQQPDRAALAAFVLEGLHANDVAALLDAYGICIRSGHHCTQPLHRLLGLSGSARASLAFTTTTAEIDAFCDELASSAAFLREHA